MEQSAAHCLYGSVISRVTTVPSDIFLAERRQIMALSFDTYLAARLMAAAKEYLS